MKKGWQHDRESKITDMLRILFWLLAFGIFSVSLFACNPKQPEDAAYKAPTEPPQPQEEEFPQARSIRYPGIIPGTTSTDEVTKILGEPIEMTVDEDLGMTVLLYRSDNEFVPDAFYIKDKVVHFISAGMNEEEPLYISSIIESYGQPDQKTYSLYSAGTMMYLYPELGLSLLVDEQQGAVLFEHLFVPMKLEAYFNLWGKDLPLENPYMK